MVRFRIINDVVLINLGIDELRKMVQWDTNEKSRFIEELRSNPEFYRNRPLTTEKYT
jgi:hypothetical protein